MQSCTGETFWLVGFHCFSSQALCCGEVEEQEEVDVGEEEQEENEFIWNQERETRGCPTCAMFLVDGIRSAWPTETGGRGIFDERGGQGGSEAMREEGILFSRVMASQASAENI